MIAISIGDVNGISCEILLRSLGILCELTQKSQHKPIICAHAKVLESALDHLLRRHSASHIWQACGVCNVRELESLLTQVEFVPPLIPSALSCDARDTLAPPSITPSLLTQESGAYSFASFLTAIELVESHRAKAVVTLPIHKAAWQQAGIHYPGHTEYLRARYKQEAIMVLGWQKMFVALFCDHIPLHRVSERITKEAYKAFLLRVYDELLDSSEQALVLGFNPHCGDNGAIGGAEDAIIQEAINEANAHIQTIRTRSTAKARVDSTATQCTQEVFIGPCPPDSAFAPHMRKKFRVFLAPYHDVGLAPLKALYFDESINVSLNLPIIRTSVDHGVAFDIAYMLQASTQSFHNALRFAIAQIHARTKQQSKPNELAH